MINYGTGLNIGDLSEDMVEAYYELLETKRKVLGVRATMEFQDVERQVRVKDEIGRFV